MDLKKMEVRLAFSGYITIEVEAANEIDARDKALKMIDLDDFFQAIENQTFYPDEEKDLIVPFFNSLQRWPEADMIDEDW